MAHKGKTQKSPKFKHAMKREAEKNVVKASKSTCNAKNMSELLKDKK